MSFKLSGDLFFEVSAHVQKKLSFRSDGNTVEVQKVTYNDDAVLLEKEITELRFELIASLECSGAGLYIVYKDGTFISL